MKLYFIPGACSLAPHIALREAGLSFSLLEVDYQTRQTVGGGDYFGVNPKGYVPALELDDGQLLTEVPVILQYVDSLAPLACLLPPEGIRVLFVDAGSTLHPVRFFEACGIDAGAALVLAPELNGAIKNALYHARTDDIADLYCRSDRVRFLSGSVDPAHAHAVIYLGHASRHCDKPWHRAG
ncbi:glutathione S-transferase N-terminal domain-containing protein [Roseovarius sp. 2305UL8-3]|uniref:glutathione S-transferase N-terminal domain-containing protein n=1 Tax=Roseovarius conchicola TaxID=3121636 RepID=UPI0035270EC3